MNDEPRRANVGLDNVFWFRTGIFEAGRSMLDDGFSEDFVEIGSFDFLVAGGVDFGGEFKKLGDVMTGFGTGD